MEAILWFFLPMILFLGIVTSYEDIKYGKIRNKWIILALAYGVVVYAAFIVFYLVNNTLNANYVTDIITNILLSLFVGFGMWYGSLWSAGDAKLFFAYSVLIPLSAYSLGYTKYFPSMTLLISTFVPIFLFFFIYLLFKTNLKQKRETLKTIFEPKSLFNSLISLITIFWLIRLFFSFINMGNNVFLSMVFSLLVYFLLNKIFSKKLLIAMVLILIVRLFVDRSIYSLEFLRNIFSLFVFWILIKGFVFDLGFKLFTKEMKISEIKEGMIPAEMIFKGKKGYEKEKMNFGFLNIKNKKYLYENIPEGSSTEEIEKIKKLYKERRLKFKTIKIEQTVPFAPFMFFGVILTLFAKGNILILAKIIIFKLIGGF